MDVTPRDRPISLRRTVRVLLLDDAERLLLMHDSDQGLPADDPAFDWWMTPGGGIDPGEDVVAAAVRELDEETGLVVSPDSVVGPIATVHVRHGYSDKVVESDDTYVLVRCRAFEISTAGFTEDEQRTVLGQRWWTRAELDATSETIWPARLGELWDALADPSAWPLSLPDVEESTVP